MTTFDEPTKTWSGPYKAHKFREDATLGEILLESLSKAPGNIAQICDSDGIKLTCGQLTILSVRVAQNLKNFGYKHGEVVGLVTKNSTYLTPVVFGCFLAGLPINPLDPSFEKEDIAHLFMQTKPAIVFCDAECLKNVREAVKDLDVTPRVFTLLDKVDGFEYVDVLLRETEEEDEFELPDIKDTSATVCAILCSSGTTGRSKGVMLSHSQCLTFISCGLRDFQDNKSSLCFSSLYWFSGFATMIMAAANQQTRLITTKPFTPELFLELVKKYQIESVFTPPSHIAMILQSPNLEESQLDSIRLWISGGSFVSPFLVQKLKGYVKNGAVYSGYGMTEVGSLVSSTEANSNSVGQLSHNISLRVQDDDGNLLGTGETGELLIKPQRPFLGYFGNKEATKDALSEGWIVTGDMGYIDKEGFLFLVDRKKDIIKYRNFQISPNDIESYIQKLDGVMMVCVVGIPDEFKTLDLPAAVIVKTKESSLSKEYILNKTMQDLPDYKQLRGGVYFVDEFPMTPSGKIKRKVVRDSTIKLFQAI